MYEESSRRKFFSGGLLSLILKFAVIAVFIFILCWLFTRNNNKATIISENSSSYVNNITAMKEAALEYFTSDKLPTKVGGTQKLSLSQMLDQKLLIDFTDNGKTCDVAESYVQVTKTADENYALKVNLNCGKNSDFIVTTIEKQTTQTCNLDGKCEELLEKLDETIANLENKTNNTSSSSSNKNQSTNDKNVNISNNNNSSSSSSSSSSKK